ncbi:hypothetical protein [Planctomyces sp. SH-PL14]|uniref:hypothetical protein n=1 Tax=Planctomyces sp. SH-PL14 TaxID=1632864 RepID=UPI00078EAD12|nr:hypothetical protein [Planctomyces sp. SH-PL14]AMV17538.1 hypothetical protein VT03_06575 [Planctomyces sp. SH-PL14]
MNRSGILRSILLLIGVLATVGVIANPAVPLGVPNEWTWPRRTLAGEDWFDLGLAAGAGGLYCWWAMAGRKRLARSGAAWIRAWVAGLWPVTLVWWGVLLSLLPIGTGLDRFPWVLGFPGSSGYFTQAQNDVHSTQEFLQTYRKRVTEAEGMDRYLHLGTHPPGLTLVFHGLRQFCEASPLATRLAEASRPGRVVEAFQVFNSTAPPDRKLTAPDAAALWLGGLLAMFGAALGGPAIYGLARRWTDPAGAWSAAALWPLVPAIIVFLPKSDALFGGLAPALAWIWFRSVDKGSAWRAVLFGLLLYGCVTLSLAFLPLAFLIGVASLLEVGLVRGESPASAGELATPGKGALGRTFRNVAWALCGFLIPWLGLWIWAGYDTLGVWLQNLRNHAEFYAHSPRTYLQWLWVNPLELAMAVGAPIVLSLALSLAAAGRIAPRQRAQIAAWGLVWGILWLTGKNMGEAARLWCFLLSWPILAVAVPRPSPDDPSSGASSAEWIVLLLGQLAVCIVTTFYVNGFSFG